MHVELPDPDPGRCRNLRMVGAETVRCLDYDDRPHICSFPEPRPPLLSSDTYTVTPSIPEPWVKPDEVRQTPTQDRVVDLMTALEKSVADAKAARIARESGRSDRGEAEKRAAMASGDCQCPTPNPDCEHPTCPRHSGRSECHTSSGADAAEQDEHNGSTGSDQ